MLTCIDAVFTAKDKDKKGKDNWIVTKYDRQYFLYPANHPTEPFTKKNKDGVEVTGLTAPVGDPPADYDLGVAMDDALDYIAKRDAKDGKKRDPQFVVLKGYDYAEDLWTRNGISTSVRPKEALSQDDALKNQEALYRRSHPEWSAEKIRRRALKALADDEED